MTTDKHKERAAEIFKVSVADVTPEQRRFAKIANYLEWYRAGPEPFRMVMQGQNQQQLPKKEPGNG